MSKQYRMSFALLIFLAFCSFSFAQTSVGLGGGGSIYAPVVAPYNSNIIFVACDMSGVYRTMDGGATWKMMDEHQIQSGIYDVRPDLRLAFSVAFDPLTQGHIIGINPSKGLMESF